MPLNVVLDDSMSNCQVRGWVRSSMLRTGKPVHSFELSGFFDTGDLVAALGQQGGEPLLCSDDEGAEVLYGFPTGTVDLFLSKVDKVNVRGVFFDAGECARVRDALKELVKLHAPSGTFHVLTKNCGGYALTNAGLTDTPLVRENYTQQVLRDVDHVVECMRSHDPCGRLVVLDGPPGVGKSYAIRALAKQVDATFVVVAPSLVGSLSGPELIPVLLAEKKEGRPVVLVMEDADHALVTRERGDLRQLSELLNIGDGLLGDLVDLRIVATTNAKRDDLDDAVVRPGRLCRRVSMGYLPPHLYEEIYERLTGKPWQKLVPQNHTLADVYRMARDAGWRPAAKPPTGQYL